MNSFAYIIVSGVAPKKRSIGSRKYKVTPPNTIEWIRQNVITLLTTSVALPTFFCPRKMEEIVAPPAAISVQKAITRFISGSVMASPAIAMGPTPLPMNILSTMLYTLTATLAMMAGMEYCTRSLPIGSVPSVVGSDCRGAWTEAVCVELYDFDISAVLKRLPNGLPSFIIMQI